MTFHNPIHEGVALETKAEGDDLDGQEAELPEALTAALDGIRTDLVARLEKLETKSADTERRLSRPAVITGTVETKAEDAGALERKAFVAYLRHGERDLDVENRKMLRASVDTAGGFTVPSGFETDLVRDLTLVSPIRAIATVKSTGLAQVAVTKRVGITNARWQGEAVATIGSEPSFGGLVCNIKTLATHVDLSNQLAEDSFANMDAEVRDALANDFAAKEGRAFLFGAGGLEPDGLMMDPEVPVFLNGHATNLSADRLIDMLYSLAAPYRANSTWVMQSNTLAALRKLKDTTGNYIWQPGLQAGQPETLLGRPVTVAEDMDKTEANAFPIVLGDFRTAFRIYDRVGMDVKVNPYLLMTEGQTRFHGIRRVGSIVVQPKALTKLKMATA